MRLSNRFPAYTGFDPQVPVFAISPPGRPACHRFYDTSPISPSGRLIAYTEFEDDSRLPRPGEPAFVVVRDLESGREVYRSRTAAWDTQLGAQAQWGAEDGALFFNRMDRARWQPYGVRVDSARGEERRLQGPVYMVSPDGRQALSPSLTRTGLVQPGYGVTVPPETVTPPRGAEAEDGLWITDTETGACRLLVSFAAIHARFPGAFAGLDPRRGGFHGFHAKWSPRGDRILFILRWRDRRMRPGQSRNWLVTMDAAGGDLRLALDDRRWRGGHHPNWCPDGRHIVMNLAFRNPRVPFGEAMRLLERVARRLKLPFDSGAWQLRLARFRHDGSDLRVVAPGHRGSGHPTWHAGLDAVLTDAYPDEPVAAGDGTVPIRLIPAGGGAARELLRMPACPAFSGPRREWRVDPHPAWDRAGRRIVLNGCPNGHRQVFLADLSALIPAEAAA
jgi:hypothetical protein